MARKSETESVSRLVFYGTVLLIGWLAYRIVHPFLVGFAGAVGLAILLQPVRVRVPVPSASRPAIPIEDRRIPRA